MELDLWNHALRPQSDHSQQHFGDWLRRRALRPGLCLPLGPGQRDADRQQPLLQRFEPRRKMVTRSLFRGDRLANPQSNMITVRRERLLHGRRQLKRHDLEQRSP